MKKKLIGLISLFILAETVCIIGWNIQINIPPVLVSCWPGRDSNCTLEYINALIVARDARITPWSTAIRMTGYIFVILLMILLSFSYYQKRKNNSAFPLETLGMAQ